MQTTLIMYTIRADGQPVLLDKGRESVSPYATVSRVHARLDPIAHMLENVGPRLLLVDRVPLRRGQQTQLRDGAEVMLGGLRLNYFLN